MVIENKKVVAMHYTLTNDEGKVIDSSAGKDPLHYLQGYQNIIPGLEKALVGKKIGDKLSVKVQPEEAYGVKDPKMVSKVERKMLENIPNLQLGMQLQADGNQGQQIVTIVEIDEQSVTLDGNHPLAGLILNFDVEIMDICDASDEEIAHGHVHGPGGHHH